VAVGVTVTVAVGVTVTEGEADALAEGVIDAEGLGEPEAGQVCVRLNFSAVPVITAEAAVRIEPAGVTTKAFDVAGPPLEKLFGLAAAVIVIVSVLKVAVSETKSPLIL
jgi:hypothetical protein